MTQFQKFFILCVTLLLVALSIPKLSSASIFFFPFVFSALGYLSIPKKLIKNIYVSTSISLLVLFTLSSYIITYFYGFEPYKTALSIVPPIIVINIMFILGILLNYKKIPFFPYNFIVVNTFLIAGGVIWVFLSVAKSTNWELNILALKSALLVRHATSFWSDSGINGPTLDMFSSLGVSLIGTNFSAISFFLVRAKKLRNSLLLVGISLAFVSVLLLMSIYSTIPLLGRTPIVVFLSSIFLTFFYENRILTLKALKGRVNYALIFYIFFFAAVTILSAEIVYHLFRLANDIGFGYRLAEDGVESTRYQAWLEVMSHGWDFPFGGRAFRLNGVSAAHNIWLDQLYDAGILPMVFLLSFHIILVPVVVSFFRLSFPKEIHIFALCTMASFFFTFLGAPVLQASYRYFGITCFFFGSVIRLSYDFKSVMSTALPTHRRQFVDWRH